MYDQANWCQVWLSMGGTSNRAAALFWFRIAFESGVFPFGSTLASDAAHFFANCFGYTSEALNGLYYVHAYLATNYLGFPFHVHGYSTYPYTPPAAEPTLPLNHGLLVHRDTRPRTRNERVCFSPVPESWVDDGRPNGIADAWLAGANAIFPTGFTSQGRLLVPVVVSYKDRSWSDVDQLRLGDHLGFVYKRGKPRTDRTIGDVPKLLP